MPFRRLFPIVLILILCSITSLYSQIPMDNILKRVSIPSEGDLRGLVDLVGFPQTSEQMDFIGKLCEDLEKQAIKDNQKEFNIDDNTSFICGISPHDDYMLAGRVYPHVHRNIRAKTVILIGNAHWGEAFGIRNKLIFGDFKYWRGPYGNVKISELRENILKKLGNQYYTVNRKLVETEHSLEGLVPFLQYYNRDVEIIPVLVPFTDWENMRKIGKELADVVSEIAKEMNLKLGKDLAVLCSTDGQHYGDYGWSYYNYHPFGCDIDGYEKAVKQDENLINEHLTGKVSHLKINGLFSKLVDQNDISNYKITWCGRFSAPFAVNFSNELTRNLENRDITGMFFRHGTTLSDPWLPLNDIGLGVTADTNLHHFVTFFSIGYK